METKKSKMEELLLKNWSFPILLAMLCAGVWGGTHMLYVNGSGMFNDLLAAQMFISADSAADYMTLGLFGLGYLIARMLEGPLVGVLDIGGSVATGVGLGLPSLCLAFGFALPVENFAVALIFGAVIGYALGVLVIVMKNSMKEGVTASGANIMMGAGNALGSYLGPLVILSACKYSIGAGIGALVGSVLFYKLDKPITGGAILGSMIFGLIF